MKRFFLYFIFSFLAIGSAKVMAQYGQYGVPSPTYEIIVDKMVSKPGSAVSKEGIPVDFVDNLAPSDPRFSPGNEVFFKIKVKNTSSERLENVEVIDYVPSYLEFLEGPGVYDKNSRTLRFTISALEPEEEKEYILKMRVFSQDFLPYDKGLFCLVNKVQAKKDDVKDEDTAQFCIEKQVEEVEEVPKAGPEFGIVLVASQLMTLAFGLYLRKKAN